MPPLRLTDEQMKATSILKGKLQILACAGSGKTETVSRRIANIVKSGTPAKAVVAFTFTEKAAEELRVRIRKILEEECPGRADIGELYIGTIHSFCFEMLKRLRPEYRSYEVLDDNRRVAFISMPERYYKSHLERLRKSESRKGGKAGKFAVISKFFESYDLVRVEGISLSELTNSDFVECCIRYEGMLDEDRYIDFTGMVHRLVDLLEKDRGAKAQLNEMVKHLVVDEYQDIDPLQERLVRLIADGCESLCVVGDDDQCIYNWRGSDVENIISFTRRYPEAISIPLSVNFRSTARIIECASNFIRKNQNRIKKAMIPRQSPPNPSEPDDLFYRHFDTEEEEFDFIVERIRSLNGTDFRDKNGSPFSLSYGDFAILVRTKKEAVKIIKRLDDAIIPCVVDIGAEVFGRPEVDLALRCLAYAFGIGMDNKPVTPKDLEDRYDKAFLKRADSAGKRAYPLADKRRFMDSIRRIREEVEALEPGYLPMGIQPFFHKILQAFGADRFQFEDAYCHDLAVLSQAIADYESVWRRLKASDVKYFFGFISAYGSRSYSEASHSELGAVDAVKILTIHRAKGLEFPVVFVPGFVEEAKPPCSRTYVDEDLYDAERYRGSDEDERRVYYTAITRSEKYLCITGSAMRMKEDGNPYKAKFPPHRFKGELDVKRFFSDRACIKRTRSGHPPRASSAASFPTSFSDLNCFMRCGHDYLIRKVYGFEPGVPPAFGYGSNLHNILNIIYSEYIKKRAVPDPQQISELFDRHFFLRYATEEMSDRMKDAGKRVIGNYVRLNAEDFSAALETEKSFELVIDGALISGRIDLLKRLDPNGNVRAVEIIDFKSEDEINKAYSQDRELQLRLYAIACMRSLGLDPKKACVHYLDENRREHIPIAPEDLEGARQKVSKIVSEITGKRFAPSPSERCGGCDWRIVCPHSTNRPGAK